MSKFVNCDDPGHNHTSTGNRAPDRSYYEYEGAQAIADMAGDLYGNIPEISQVKTKELMTYPTSLEMRVRIAHEARANLFQSHHSNAWVPSGGGLQWTSPRGFGVYVYLGQGNSRLARIAHKWCRELLLPFGLPDRGIRERNFYVLRETRMPSVLYEWAFHTNREDVRLLLSPEFRAACAEVSVRVACEFLGVEFRGKEDTVMATPKYVVTSGDTMWAIARAHSVSLSELQGFNPHIEDGASIKAEHGGDWIFLAKPNQFELEYARTRAALIRCRINAPEPGQIKELEELLKARDQDIVDLGKIVKTQGNLLDEIRALTANRPKL